MNEEPNLIITDKFKHLYDDGYRCINYEINKEDHLFTVYLKNFETEEIQTLKCDTEEGIILKNYIDRLLQ
ncbi:MAG: hypothetical protein ACOX0L_08735 [Natronincolaceae bacterium]|jgi:hypothetical protein|nr:hypothetical protein [Bacillota bacterium]NLK91469.1 hypothetical protein [Clostridiales bacterium]